MCTDCGWVRSAVFRSYGWIYRSSGAFRGVQRKPDPSLAPVELAAYAAVSSLILNLDEAISKS